MTVGYYVCDHCGHVEPVELGDDGYSRPCPFCSKPLETRAVFDRLDSAELYSERVKARA